MQRVRATEHEWGTRVELCAPQRRNALDQQSVADLREVFATGGSGPVLLCAQGPVFCAGGDLEVLSRAARDGGLGDLLVTAAAAFADLIEVIVGCPRPVVTAVDGPAVGGGVSLALAGDVLLATPRARLVLGWARIGLPPDGHAATLLAHAVGPALAEELLADCAEISADSDVAASVFTRIVGPAELEAAALTEVQHATKAPGRGRLLAAMAAARDEELAALARAAADEVTGERLAVVYKIDR